MSLSRLMLSDGRNEIRKKADTTMTQPLLLPRRRRGLVSRPYIIPATTAVAIVSAIAEVNHPLSHPLLLPVRGHTSIDAAEAGLHGTLLLSLLDDNPPSASASSASSASSAAASTSAYTQPASPPASPHSLPAGAYAVKVRRAPSVIKQGGDPSARTSPSHTSPPIRGGGFLPGIASVSPRGATVEIMVMAQPTHARGGSVARVSPSSPLDLAVLANLDTDTVRALYPVGSSVEVCVVRRLADFNRLATGPWLRDTLCRLCDAVGDAFEAEENRLTSIDTNERGQDSMVITMLRRAGLEVVEGGEAEEEGEGEQLRPFGTPQHSPARHQHSKDFLEAEAAMSEAAMLMSVALVRGSGAGKARL